MVSIDTDQDPQRLVNLCSCFKTLAQFRLRAQLRGLIHIPPVANGCTHLDYQVGVDSKTPHKAGERVSE